MRAILIASVCVMILTISVACESSDDESPPAAAQVADLSQFPTPTRSQAQPIPTSPPTAVQSQPDQTEADTAELAPMTPEEMQQLRQRMQSGELSEEEMQQAIQRIRAQFGGGQGGPPFGADAGSVAVGSIESVAEDTITVKTELASVTASVGENTNVRITSVLDTAALTANAQVMVVSERAEGVTLARIVTILPEGQADFRGGRGGFGGGQGGQRGFGASQGTTGGDQAAGAPRPLFGTLENVTDAGFTLETQQGPLPISMDDQSLVIQTRQGTIADLETGMLVRIAGPADEDGKIDARTVSVTPEGLEDFPGLGAPNRAGARGPAGGN